MNVVKNWLRYGRRVVNSYRGIDVVCPIQVRLQKLRLGNERAAWCVSPSTLTRESVVYSFGVGTDVSFDLELITRFGLNVHAFDPTPRSLAWVRSQSFPPEFKFHDYGLANFDGMANFVPPEKDAYVSFRLSDATRAAESSSEAPVYRLSSIMQMLNHTRIDVLKMDIEGAEYDAIKDILASDLEIGQILVEFHHSWKEIGVAKTKEAIRLLNEAGYRIFDISPGNEYSFARV